MRLIKNMIIVFLAVILFQEFIYAMTTTQPRKTSETEVSKYKELKDKINELKKQKIILEKIINIKLDTSPSNITNLKNIQNLYNSISPNSQSVLKTFLKEDYRNIFIEDPNNYIDIFVKNNDSKSLKNMHVKVEDEIKVISTTIEKENENKKEYTQGFDSVYVGLSVQFIGFNLGDGKIQLFKTASPISLTILPRIFQDRITVNEADKKYFYTCWWSFSIGITIGSQTFSSDQVTDKLKGGSITEKVVFGFTIVPWALKIHTFTIGVGISYLTAEKFTLKSQNFSFVIPVSYLF